MPEANCWRKGFGVTFTEMNSSVPAVTTTHTFTYFVTASSLFIRSGPSATAAAVGALAAGDRVEVMLQPDSLPSSSDPWTRLLSPKVGWVATKYLRKEEFPWMDVATGELGQSERPGHDTNPRIAQYLASTTLDHELSSSDETPWCSGFVNWCVENAGHAGTNSAAAESWLHWGVDVKEPRRGLIAVFSRLPKGHHVAFCTGSWSDALLSAPGSRDVLMVLGGNQQNRVCVAGYHRPRLLSLRAPR